MDQYHKPAEKKVSKGTGGKRRKFRDKSLAHVGGRFAATKVGDKDVKAIKRRRGGSTRMNLKRVATVNVTTKSGMKKEKILRVLESHNPEFIRMNIITKGAVVETKLGKVKVTNRVGQDGIVNGVLLS